MEHNIPGHSGKQKKRIKRRINLQPAANEKSFEVDGLSFFIFAEQQSGNQKSAQHKKQVHARPSHMQKERRNIAVMDNYGDNRDASQNIQPLISHRL
jgi:hypothetical protein